MSNAELGAEALEAGHLALGVKGLELLTDGASRAEAAGLLAQVMLTRKDRLAIEAAKLLMEPRGKVATAAQALSAADESLRNQAVAWLVSDYDNDAKAPNGAAQGVGVALSTCARAGRDGAGTQEGFGRLGCLGGTPCRRGSTVSTSAIDRVIPRAWRQADRLGFLGSNRE